MILPVTEVFQQAKMLRVNQYNSTNQIPDNFIKILTLILTKNLLYYFHYSNKHRTDFQHIFPEEFLISNKITRYLYSIFFLILFNFSTIFCQSVNVPLDHWLYNFLDRLETRGFVDTNLLRTRPISRQDVAAILANIERLQLQKLVSFSQAEADLFEQLKGEFYEELFDLNLRANPRYYERHLLQWNEQKARIRFDALFKQRFDVYRSSALDSTRRTAHTTGGGVLRGTLANSLAFYLQFENTLVRGEGIHQENFNPSQGMPTVISGENVYQDDAAAYLVWRLPWFDLEFGRDNAAWGPGYQGSLMLSANCPRFDMLRLRANYQKFHFTSIHGKLISSLGEKYLAAHRIEIQPFRWLYLGGSESVIYGNRGIEFSYLNPIMPFHIAEHHLGDRDNNTLGADFAVFPAKNHKFYGELFIDDFTSAENPFTYFGNKFAFLTGYYWVNPFSISNLDFRAEYTRIEPNVYSHHDSINVYQNYNQHIGHWLEPNSDQLYSDLTFLVSRDLQIKVLGELIRHGKGNINSPHLMSEGTQKSFLSGVVEQRWRFGISVTDQILRDVFLTLQYNFVDVNNEHNLENNNQQLQHIVFTLSGNW